MVKRYKKPGRDPKSIVDGYLNRDGTPVVKPAPAAVVQKPTAPRQAPSLSADDFNAKVQAAVSDALGLGMQNTDTSVQSVRPAMSDEKMLGYSIFLTKLDICLDQLAALIRPDMTEKSIQEIMETILIAEGITETWRFEKGVKVQADEAGYGRTVGATIRAQDHDIVTIDLAPRFNRLNARIVRSLYIEDGFARTRIPVDGNEAMKFMQRMRDDIHGIVADESDGQTRVSELFRRISDFVVRSGCDQPGLHLGHALEDPDMSFRRISPGNKKTLADLRIFSLIVPLKFHGHGNRTYYESRTYAVRNDRVLPLP